MAVTTDMSKATLTSLHLQRVDVMIPDAMTLFVFNIAVDLVGWPLVNIQTTCVSNHHVPSGKHTKSELENHYFIAG